MKLFFIIFLILTTSCSPYIFYPCDGLGETADAGNKLFPMNKDSKLKYEKYIFNPASRSYDRMLYGDKSHFTIETRDREIIKYNDGSGWRTIPAMRLFMTDSKNDIYLLRCSKGILFVSTNDKREVSGIVYAVPDFPADNYVDPAAKNQIWRGKINIDTEQGDFTAYVLEIYDKNLFNPIIPKDIATPISSNYILSRVYFTKDIGIVKIELFKAGEINPEYVYELISFDNASND